MKYYHVLLVLQPQNKVVEDFVLHMGEKEFNAYCFNVATQLEQKGLAFNGKNINHYYVFLTRDITEEYVKVKKVIKSLK